MAVTNAEKIADALRAGPVFVTKDATMLDWPPTPEGEYGVLRKGSSQWTCLTAIPGHPHDEPGCFDRVFLRLHPLGSEPKQEPDAAIQPPAESLLTAAKRTLEILASGAVVSENHGRSTR